MTTSTFKYVIALLFFTFLPETVFAQGTGPVADIAGAIGNLFAPTPDLSISYLGQIFGTVGTVLHGTSGQLLGNLFKILNLGILVLASIFLIYTTVMTIITASMEGEFLGKKYNAAWIVLRILLGFGLLAPSASTGYSLIQVFVMWTVIQGVYFADLTWGAALKYLASGGAIFTPPATNIADSINLIGTTFQSLVCMRQNEAAQKAKQQYAQQQLQQDPTKTQFQQDAQPFPSYTPQIDEQNMTIGFPARPGNKDNICGLINWKGSSADPQDQSNQYKRAAILQVILDIDDYARRLIQAQSGTAPTDLSNLAEPTETALVNGAADWVNITLPLRYLAFNISDLYMAIFGQSAYQQGWIVAGRYYYALGEIQRKVMLIGDVKINYQIPPPGFQTTSGYIDFGNKNIVINQNAMQDLPAKPSDLNTSYTLGVGFVQAAYVQAVQLDEANSGLPVLKLTSSSAGILQPIMDYFNSQMNNVVGTFLGSISNGNPIVILQVVGYLLIATSLGLWLGASAGAFTLQSILGIMPSVNSIGPGISDALKVFIPMYIGTLIALYVTGATLAFYVPLIPYIIFVFSALGWFVAVIEAMVAAPIVALGVTHPEGHDLLGKSEQAVMLLLGVFLRPVLMIIGLLAGMVLSFVALRFLNATFWGIVVDVGDINPFAVIAVIIIFTSLVVTIVNQCFSLIYAVPDRVMRWVGAGEQSTFATEALQASKQAFTEVVQGRAKALQKSAGYGAQERADKKEGEEETGKITRGKIK